MSCGVLENGGPPVSKLWRAEASGTGALQLLWTAPTWVKTTLVTVNWSAVPLATPEYLTIYKDHAGTVYDVLLYQVDPSTTGANLTDLVLFYQWTLEPGEVLRIEYLNSNANTVSAEAYFQMLTL